MISFATRLSELQNVQWDNEDCAEQIDNSLKDFLIYPDYFAGFLVEAFTKNNTEITEQLRGILFFIVHRYPEIFILIRISVDCLGETVDSNLKSLLEIYSFYLKES